MCLRPGANNGGNRFLLITLKGKAASRKFHIVQGFGGIIHGIGGPRIMPLKDPEARKKYQREYRLAHLEEYKQRDREYRENNPEKI